MWHILLLVKIIVLFKIKRKGVFLSSKHHLQRKHLTRKTLLLMYRSISAPMYQAWAGFPVPVYFPTWTPWIPVSKQRENLLASRVLVPNSGNFFKNSCSCPKLREHNLFSFSRSLSEIKSSIPLWIYFLLPQSYLKRYILQL